MTNSGARFEQGLAASALALIMATCGAAAVAQPGAAPRHPPSIVSITVCSEGSGDPGPSCPNGTFDTHRLVLGPDGQVINANGVHGATDEHASIFPPGSLRGNKDYLLFVASGTSVNPDIGVVVLSGGSGPGKTGQWTTDFARDYGNYDEGFGTVFLAPARQGSARRSRTSPPRTRRSISVTPRPDPWSGTRGAGPGSYS